MQFGAQLRSLRKIKNLTLAELGERTDLTKGYLSQVENDQTSPTLETLSAILTVLGVSLADFFAKKAQSPKIVYPQEQQVDHLDDDLGYQLTWLINNSNEQAMEPVMLTLQPRGTFKSFSPSPAETFVYVLQGQVCLHLGQQKFVANTHESLYYTAMQTHQLQNPFSQPARVLLIATESYL